MQDLDFEELDKAVNSLMPKASQPQNTTTAVPDQSAAIPTPIAQPNNTVNPSPRPIDRPSTGRFMDVVHPSSDMRSSLDVPQRPLSPSMTPVQAVAPQPVASLSTESKPVASTNNWAGLPNYQPPAAAPESPFLPDTKVEKRPLGAFSNETPAIEEELLLPEKPEPATTNELDSVPDKPSIPAELDKAVLGVEPGSSTHKNDAEMSSNPLSYSSANGSISQQYAEKPVIDKPVTSSIYDNGVYNAATSKPAKKKSSWLIVIWIIILLIVGVGAGLAFYYFMPNFKLPF